MDADTLDLIIRSRSTILEILENRGYNVDSYKGISPEEVLKLATTNTDLLRINAPKKEDGPAPMNRAVVLYWVNSAVRLRIETEMTNLFDEENPNRMDPTNDDIMIILGEPFHDVFHIQAAKQWNSRKARIGFFQIKNVISNPTKHIMVPPHRKLSQAEITALIPRIHLKTKSELPHIKFHVDMQARVLGLVPGDVVEIRRPSETAGESIIYSYCSL
jgi:DNA-directed RNA polymerase subunit H (RpoH/RPB5)